MWRADAKRRQLWTFWILLIAMTVLLFPPVAHATAPHFTGLQIVAPPTGGIVNLRSQGAISGSGPITVESVSILPLALGIRAEVVNGVCVRILNPLGLDFLSLGAILSVVVTNPEAPGGVRGTIVVLPGIANNNDLEGCADPSRAPVANAGSNRTVPDTDGAAGEVVTLDGSRSTDPDGTIVSYVWTNLDTNQILGNGMVIQPRLADGSHQIRLTVEDNTGGPDGTASTTINVIVRAPAASGPTANAGTDQRLFDTDGILGELITLDASASVDIGGQVISFEWLDAQQNLLGLGVTLTVRLPDGLNKITLRVTGSDLLTATTSITVEVAGPLLDDLLETLPSLTPNQRSVAIAVDDLCVRLAQLADTQPLPPSQLDLLNRCNGIIATVDPADQIEALEQLGSADLAALRTQALLFSTVQHSGVMQRLTTMRTGGGRGGMDLNFGGSTFSIDGKPVPAGQLQLLAEKVCEIAACAAAGGEPAGSLLSDRLGLWARANYDVGEKGISASSDGFKGKQWGLTAGADYRLGRRSVAGLAVGYGRSHLDFRPETRGGLSARSWTASLYGSNYLLENLFVDAVVSFGTADYDTTRHIVYSEGGTPVERTALGQSDGKTLSAGLSAGYDWSLGGFTLSPSMGYFLTRAKIDAFDETGADGLDLSYGNQSHKSSEANLSISLNYALSTPWMVVVPHLRADYLHEFNKDMEVFGVHFVNDPFADAANPTPPIVVRSDVPDQWYWRMAAGVSAQFKFGISGYVEYQRLQDFQYMNFENFTLGVRFQRSLN